MRVEKVQVAFGVTPTNLSFSIPQDLKPGDIIYFNWEVNDFGDRLPNDFCDYCTSPIETQIFRNCGACSGLHQEYEYWEEMFGETIA